MAEASTTRLFLGTVPDLVHLEVLEGEAFDCYTLLAAKAKCRELVRGDALVMAAPINNPAGQYISKREPQNVWIISKKGYITSDSAVIQQRLANVKIKIIKQIPINLDILQACYQFTLTARLAPKWNIVGEWICKGCDVFKTGRAQALKFDVGITAKEITISLIALKLTIDFLKPVDLNVSTTLLNRFQKEPQLVINETTIINNRCFVIPNFTQAHIFSAAHSVSPLSSFDSYDKIRLHWKKQYGFILPDSQNLFYEVYFRCNPGTFFSYPGCCVTTSPPVVCPSKDTDQLITSFINDIHSRMPSCCGQQIKFSKKPLTSSNTLIPVVQIDQSDSSTGMGPYLNTRPIPIPNRQVVLGKPNLPPLGGVGNSSQVVPSGKNRSSGNSSWLVSSDGLNNCDDAAVPVYYTQGTSTVYSSDSSHSKGLSNRYYKKTTIGDMSINHSDSTTTARYTQSNTQRYHSNATSYNVGPRGIDGQSTTKRTPSLHPPTDYPQPKRTCSGTIVANSTGVGDELSRIVPSMDRELSSYPYCGNSEDSIASINNPNKVNKNGSLVTESEELSSDTMKLLQRTKVTSLKEWLKQNGVSCTSKDRKEELVRKVVCRLQETGQKQFQLLQ